MIHVRRAFPVDTPQIAHIHVAVWRDIYPGILPDAYLAGLSVRQTAVHYQRMLMSNHLVYVAEAGAGIVGFASAGRSRWVDGLGRPPGEGEIETLYVLSDWRELGCGKALLRAAAAGLIEVGCRSVYLWVLAENPSRWFYERLGGRTVARATIGVAGRSVPQIAMAWDPIGRLLETNARAE